MRLILRLESEAEEYYCAKELTAGIYVDGIDISLRDFKFEETDSNETNVVGFTLTKEQAKVLGQFLISISECSPLT